MQHADIPRMKLGQKHGGKKKKKKKRRRRIPLLLLASQILAVSGAGTQQRGERVVGVLQINMWVHSERHKPQGKD